MRTSSIVASAALTACLLGHAAQADIISIQGSPAESTEGLGRFTGSIEYNFQSGNTGQLILNLTNTTDPGLGGFITGFVFNIGAPQRSGEDTALLLSSSHPAMVNISGPDINGAPFGPFDAGAGIGAQFEGGGNPSGGIAVGSLGTFAFEVRSASASVLTASSFIMGPNEHNFVVRFRGFDNGGSDKVPVPVPGAVALLGAGAIAMGSRQRRRT